MSNGGEIRLRLLQGDTAAAEVLPRRPAGFVSRHAAADKFLGTRFDVEEQLVVQIAIHAGASKDVGQA
jgi:hypothetical protein